MKFFRWICGAFVTLGAIYFAVLNRQSAPVFWNPFDAAYEAPVFLIGLLPLAAGFMLGGVSMWLATLPLRREKRTHQKQIKTLEKSLEAVNENAPLPPSDFFPAIPVKFLQKKTSQS
jgi:hypothetical protein